MFRVASLTIILTALPAFSADPTVDRADVLKRMQQVMGPLPGKDNLVPLDVKVVSEEKLEGYTRKKITYATDKNDRVPAWLLIPNHKAGEKLPAMLCLHQTINIGKDEPVGLGKQDSKQQALDLVKRGYVCIAPDYPSFGDYKIDFEAMYKAGVYQSGSIKAIWNNMRAVDLLVAMPEVDAKRIGTIGHSLGGHNAIFTAAFDDRLRVTVSSCGFCSFHRYYGGNLKGWTSDRYMPRIAKEYNNDPKKVPFDFTDVVASLAPRAFFAMSPLHDSNFDVEGVYDVIKYAKPVYEKLKAGDRLKAIHPDAKHEWPAPARKEAYEFIDAMMK